ncbi:MAG: RIP metalloprotease RseP [Dethiobacteria bacterium]|jgi:regulator of sigma E protease|nr:RIP metalloprotease RseP [Bacillota bacterium]HOA34926.1 RIP metalloprotease RseP [Bacillota bacterium]HOJ84566.1 RIP metalloprotease RseP [Bacillota bacterium]HOL16050.1 RIP metalloprotease RseP [Bacillota bacterium]
MQTLIAAVIIFGILVFVHEFGHFIAARLNGVRVLELAIGMGPRVISRQKGETVYSLRLFPLGGFCRMLGENPDEINEPGSLPGTAPARRAAIMAAGPVMNLLLSILLFFIIFYFIVGVQYLDRSTIGNVLPGTPAESAGLQEGDEIAAINGEPVEKWEEVVRVIEKHPGEELVLLVRRDGMIKEFTLIAEPSPESGKGKIGITPLVQKYQFRRALGSSFEQFGMIIASIFQVFTGQVPLDITGPVGIVITIGAVARTGIVNLLWLTALISISLGLVNLLPIPALDGGRLLFILIEALRGRPIDPEKEGMVHFIGFALLLLLILLVTYNDLLRWDILPGR